MSALIDPAPPAHTSRRTQLTEEVAAYVREKIMSGNFTPGQFLRLEPIAEAVGVSITPVREGLVALGNDGFVTPVPRRGFVVAPSPERTCAISSGPRAASQGNLPLGQQSKSPPMSWVSWKGS